MSTKEPDLEMILVKVGKGNSPEDFKLYACRGAGKGCKRNTYRARKKQCDDCVEARDEETMQQLMDRLARGDA